MIIPLNLSAEEENDLLRRGSANEVREKDNREIMMEILREVKIIKKDLKRIIKEDNL